MVESDFFSRQQIFLFFNVVLQCYYCVVIQIQTKLQAQSEVYNSSSITAHFPVLI